MSIDVAKRRILERVSLKDLLSEKISFKIELEDQSVYVLSITKNLEVLRYMTITTTALAAKREAMRSNTSNKLKA